MRCLVTGTTGQVGAAIFRRLQGLGIVIASDRGVLDLASPSQIAEKLDTLAPDLIVNPAAYTAVDRAEEERELAFVVNAASPGAIAEWAAKRCVPMIHFSTDYVFDGSGERPWREDDIACPINAYGASKLAGEEAIRSAGGSHLIVRTSWVYAAQGKNFLRTIANLAREREELRVVADQIGAPTSADFIAEVVATIVRNNRENMRAAFSAAGGTLNIAAGGATSWHGFADAIVVGLRRRGQQISTQRVVAIASEGFPTKARRPLNSRLDLSRLSSRFGVRPVAWDALLDVELDRLL